MSSSRDIRKYSSHLKLSVNEGATSELKDDQEAWDQFLNGDDQSLIFLYRKYANILYRYARQITTRQEFIRDCIQDLFFDLIRKRDSLSKAQSVKGYLFSAIKRRVLRDIKKEEKFQFEQDGFIFSLKAKSIPISVDFEEKDLSLIQKKLNELPVNQREVILLHFYEGLTYSEIAVIMDIKVRSARALTYRALESLQKQLSPYKSSFYNLFFFFL